MARKRQKARESHARADTTGNGDPTPTSVLPMEIQVGDRFSDHGFEWELLTHPTAMHGAKTLRARVVRPGLPETEREVTWLAHERVAIRRRQRSG
jgi:hypothetical protein